MEVVHLAWGWIQIPLPLSPAGGQGAAEPRTWIREEDL